VRWEDPHCNSGIFFRVEKPRDPINTSFEVQVMAGSGTGKHDMGAIYDLAGPSKAASNGTGKWNTFEIKCVGPEISVKLNGESINTINCDTFDKPGVCPDGQAHKFKLNGKPRAVKDFARSGYLGFQDHGHKVWYKKSNCIMKRFGMQCPHCKRSVRGQNLARHRLIALRNKTRCLPNQEQLPPAY
jgi:hypothetical protein